MRGLVAILLLGCALGAGRAPLADTVWTDADTVWTDANIVTGLDISGSVEPRDAQIQIDGIAMAIRAPEIVAAIRSGRYGRVGFAVFVWAEGTYPVLASWRLIGSSADALSVSDEVADRLHAIIDSGIASRLGALTDLSGALDYGGGMLRSAPFPTLHPILNIVGNGIDNVGDGARPARDRLVAQGITINGVALGYDHSIYEYFHQSVIGGPDSFVLAANDPEKLIEVMARKFVTEIVLNVNHASQALR